MSADLRSLGPQSGFQVLGEGLHFPRSAPGASPHLLLQASASRLGTAEGPVRPVPVSFLGIFLLVGAFVTLPAFLS